LSKGLANVIEINGIILPPGIERSQGFKQIETNILNKVYTVN
jgi:hypothetical protein